MITVHHLEKSRSHRVLMLLEELGVPYEMKHYARDKKTMLAPPELRRVHPLGKSPTITDGDVTVTESGAIIEYLLDRFDSDKLRPITGTPERMRYTYWLHYAEGTLMPLLVISLIMSKIANAPVPFFLKPIPRTIANKVNEAFTNPQLELHLGYVNDELGKREWFAGDSFTAADVQMSYPLEAALTRASFGDRYPNIMAFVQKLRLRPSYARAIEKGGPFEVVT